MMRFLVLLATLPDAVQASMSSAVRPYETDWWREPPSNPIPGTGLSSARALLTADERE